MKSRVLPILKKAKMPNRSANLWIKKLDLTAHPEGGWYRESYRSKEQISKEALPERFQDARNFSTAIYYLLEKGDFSAFHRIKSDEIWHFYDGDAIEIIEITFQGKLTSHCLGLAQNPTCFPQLIIPTGSWFAARPLGDYTLVGCTVSPGFDFADFEIASKNQLLSLSPDHKLIIDKLCR